MTNNFERRVAEHNAGIDAKSFTYSRRPVELVYTVMFEDVFAAIALEKIVKRWSRKKKEALIAGDEDLLKKYAKRKSVQSKLREKGELR
jgi:putative endonuclease